VRLLPLERRPRISHAHASTIIPRASICEREVFLAIGQREMKLAIRVDIRVLAAKAAFDIIFGNGGESGIAILENEAD
jgi:hypothetical protein